MEGLSVWCADGASVTPKEVKESAVFRDWVKRVVGAGIDLKSVLVVEAYAWGEPKEIRLLMLEAQAYYKGDKLDPQVYLCADVTCVVTTLVCEGRRYSVLTTQPRLAGAQGAVTDWSSGMIDSGDVSIRSAALRELFEETGTEGQIAWVVQPDPMKAFTGSEQPFGVSEGRISEGAYFVWVEAEVTLEVLTALQGRQAGLHKEGEKITVVVVPWSDVPLYLARDMRGLEADAGDVRPCLKAGMGWLLVDRMIQARPLA